MRFIIFILTLTISVISFAQTPLAELPVKVFNSSCNDDAQLVLDEKIKTTCPQNGVKYISSEIPLTLNGTVVTKNNIVIQAPSITMTDDTNVYATSLKLNASETIKLSGKLYSKVIVVGANDIEVQPKALIRSVVQTKLIALDALVIDGIISSANDAVLYANKLTISGVVNGQNSVEISVKEARLTKGEKGFSQINSRFGKLNFLVKNQLSIKSGQFFSSKISISAHQIQCESSKIIATTQMKFLTFSPNPESQSQKINFNQCKIIKGEGSEVSRVKFFKDPIWKNLGHITKADVMSQASANDIEVISEGEISIENSSIISGSSNKLIINGNRVDVIGDTYLGNIFGTSKPNINITSKLAELDGYLSGDVIALDLLGKNSRLTNNGAVIGQKINGSNIQGSLENTGFVLGKDKVTLIQKNEEGEFVNTGTIKGKNVSTFIKGKANIKDGKRIAAKTLIEVLPNSLDFSTETGEVSASNIKSHANLTVEGIYNYLDIINNSEIEEPIIQLYDTSKDPKKIIQLNKDIISDAGIEIKAPNLEVLQDVTIKTQGKLGLTANYGDLTLKHATKLESKDQVLLFANNRIVRIAKIKGSGDSASVQRSVIESGDGGVKFHSGSYFDKAGITKTSGTIVADVRGAIELIPILIEHEKKSKSRQLFGKKTRTTGYVKFFGSHWEAQSIEGLDQAQSINAINFMVNGEKFSKTGITTSEDQHVNVEHHEDIYYSYSEYSASIVGIIVRTVIIAVATYYGGPEGAAAATALTEPMTSGEVNIESMIKAAAISYAAASVGASVTVETGSNVAGAIAQNLTVDAGQIIFYGKRYSPEEFLASVASGALSGGIFDSSDWKNTWGEFLILQKAAENAIYTTVSNVINNGSIDFDSDFLEDVLVRTASDLIKSQIIGAVDKKIEEDKLKALEEESLKFYPNNVKGQQGQESPFLDYNNLPKNTQDQINSKIEGFESKSDQDKNLIINGVQKAADEAAQLIFQKPYNQLTDSELNSTFFKDELQNYVASRLDTLSGNNPLIANAPIIGLDGNENNPLAVNVFVRTDESIFNAEALIDSILNQDYELEIGDHFQDTPQDNTAIVTNGEFHIEVPVNDDFTDTDNQINVPVRNNSPRKEAPSKPANNSAHVKNAPTAPAPDVADDTTTHPNQRQQPKAQPINIDQLNNNTNKELERAQEIKDEINNIREHLPSYNDEVSQESAQSAETDKNTEYTENRYTVKTQDKELAKELNNIANQVNRYQTKTPQEKVVKELTLNLVKIADEASIAGDADSAKAFAKKARVMADFLVGWDPITGTVRDIYESFTGINMITGETLTSLERGFALFGAVTFGYGSKIGKGLKAIDKLVSSGKLSDKTGQALKAIFPNVDKLSESDIKILTHLEVGEFSTGFEGQMKLISGLHTKSGFERWKNAVFKNNELKNIDDAHKLTFETKLFNKVSDLSLQNKSEVIRKVVLDNGVTVLQFPTRYLKKIKQIKTLDKEKLRGVKTLFPESFTNEKILNIKNELMSRVDFSKIINDEFVDTIDDITYVLRFKKGTNQLETFYPGIVYGN